MEPKSWMMFRVLLNRYYGASSEELIRSLPSKYQDNLKQTDIAAADPTPLLAQPFERVSAIHYSWLAPSVQKLPKALQAPTIAALSLPQTQGICRLLKLPMPSAKPVPPLRQYLLDGLFKQISPQERLPPAYLPSSLLNPLAGYSKTQLQRLIDLLGIRDLAQEIRLVVHKTHQETILKCLTDEERKFLDFYLYKEREKLTVPRLDLKQWGGDAAKLRQQIHLRGLIRLGRALSGQNKDLLWYILHTLDTGRAGIIEQNCNTQPLDNVANELRRQVIGLINYFSKNE
ncbi:MAG: hypothetical protein Q8K75_09510 [Chlamydiales bacterium]|nr:hypothetical protein [Chlamydiales bacterium]